MYLRINQPELALEERLAAHLASQPDVVELQRQYRFADRSRADIVYKALLDGVPELLIGVVEVKAEYAGLSALAQLARYVDLIRAEFAGETVVVAGVLAAPRFTGAVLRFAAQMAAANQPFATWRIA